MENKDSSASIKRLKEFVSENYNAMYTFDSERNSHQTELCREKDTFRGEQRGKNCITLQMYSTEMFQAMQALGFYCALPMDPGQTHIECTPIPK